mgnify:CR=1 FL=1
MPRKINLKTKSLYIGCYDFEDESRSNWHTFIYACNADDKELEKHFRNVVYKNEYGEKLGKEARVDIYELRTSYDGEGKTYKVTVSSL